MCYTTIAVIDIKNINWFVNESTFCMINNYNLFFFATNYNRKLYFEMETK
jgi:hypothetical protein